MYIGGSFSKGRGCLFNIFTIRSILFILKKSAYLKGAAHLNITVLIFT